MTELDVLLNPRDPLLFRDARPFSADPGAYAASLHWPLPGTVVGTLRSAIGNASGTNWKDETQLQNILNVSLDRIFRVVQKPGSTAWVPYVPAPLDALPFKDVNGDEQLMWLYPEPPPAGAGCTWPKSGEDLLPLKVTEDVKPLKNQDWWHIRHLADWLINPHAQPLPSADSPLPNLSSEVRSHVAIERDSQTASEGMLFSTEGMVFQTREGDPANHSASAIWCRLSIPENLSSFSRVEGFVPLGGERRLSSLQESDAAIGVQLDGYRTNVFTALKDSRAFRLTLLTPAIFAKGWKPSSQLENLLGPGVRLRAAAVGNRVPVSGWNLKLNAPKPTRFAAPAGSVYFFESDQQLTNEMIERLWMVSLSDDEQDRQDGYGLCVPGVWQQ